MPSPSAAVVITAFTLDRWSLIEKAVESARTQSVPPDEVILCVDNNDELLAQARQRWDARSGVTVIASRFRDHLADASAHERAHGVTRRFGAGSARNAAAEVASSDIIVFMDDDAWAEPDWLEQLLSVFREVDGVVAAGGPPQASYETERPVWFPRSFDWVFGCAYAGMPRTRSPHRHLIACNLAIRRDAFIAVDGFHSVDFDDLDMCMRLAHRYGPKTLYFEPDAVVHHFVPIQRLTWRYFYRRCFFVNRHKVQAFRAMGPAANLAAERAFVAATIKNECTRDLVRILHREPGALRSLAATAVGIACAGLGHLRGRLDRPAPRDVGAPAFDVPPEASTDR